LRRISVESFAVGCGLATAALGFVGYASLIEHRRLRLGRRRVRIPDLPPGLRGLRVLQLSDPHVGALHGGARHLRRAWAVDADVVVVTGDLVQGNGAIAACAELLGRFRTPLGTYAILGNHDYSYPGCPVDTDALIDALTRQGVHVLRNTALRLEWQGSGFWLAGVDDPHRRRHDLAATLRTVPHDEWTLLLAHSPDVLAELPAGRVGLLLTGHTHGGQIRFPWLPALTTNTRQRFPNPYGLQRLNGTLVYLHPGLGNIIPLRFGVRPEVVCLELTDG
jgi:predicted MPP superfamily phosphohydrolase